MKEDPLTEMVRIAEEAGLYDQPQIRVCRRHLRVNVCRAKDGCAWSEDPEHVQQILDYHASA